MVSKGGLEVSDSENSSDFALFFGFGVNFGNFTLDASINEGLFFDGPDCHDDQGGRKTVKAYPAGFILISILYFT